jgi:hypothetical protein
LDVSEYFILEHNSADIMNYVARHIANVPYNSKRTATRYAVFCHKNFQLQGGDAKVHMTGAESGMEDNTEPESMTRKEMVAGDAKIHMTGADSRTKDNTGLG